MEKKFITYKLKGDLKPRGWQLPLKEVLIEKKVNGTSEGLKRVKFVPGTNSYFAEDISGQLKPVQIWFNNGELIVPVVDKVKNALLQAHPWFNIKYEIYSKEMEDARKLEALRVKNEARALVDGSDADKLQAIALAIFGAVAIDWATSTCELELLEYAEKNPLALKRELDSKEYESKYLSALAYAKGIVKNNVGKTAIVWNDSTEGIILHTAKGEKGMNVLSDYLSVRTDESELVLQAIGERLKKLDTKSTEKTTDDTEAKLKEKELELERLKQELLKYKQNSQPKPETVTTEKKESDSETELSLDEARAKYEEKFGKKTPNSYKNNLEWILGKIGTD